MLVVVSCVGLGVGGCVSEVVGVMVGVLVLLVAVAGREVVEVTNRDDVWGAVGV